MISQPRLQSGLAAAAAAAIAFCAGCTSLDTASPASGDAKKTEGNADARLVSAPMDLGFLLSMSFVEAKTLSTQELEFPPFLKIAADSIEVFKYTDDGKPRKARARGKVFIEMNFKEPAKALCQEAYITDDEIILRGSPILQRGDSRIEGLDDNTIFYMFGTSLRVIGLHKVKSQSEMAALLPALGTWAQGPNPLLPPLNENDVPSNIRSSMQRAAEAEMLHQKTREMYGPATPPPASPPPAKPKDTQDSPPPSTTAAKSKPMVEIRRAVPNKPSFWSRFKTDKTRA